MLLGFYTRFYLRTQINGKIFPLGKNRILEIIPDSATIGQIELPCKVGRSVPSWAMHRKKKTFFRR